MRVFYSYLITVITTSVLQKATQNHYILKLILCNWNWNTQYQINYTVPIQLYWLQIFNDEIIEHEY